MVVKLSIELFQQFQAHMGNIPINGFKSDKARALLAYLAIQPGIPRSRSSLATLLWPDLSEQTAHSNLRSALANLRSIIEKKNGLNPPIFLVDYQTIQLKQDSFTCDVTIFERYLANGQLEKALAAYRGRLLAEFYSGSPEFDDWQQNQADMLSQKAVQGLNTLIRDNFRLGDYSKAIQFCQKQLTIDTVNEEAHQNMIYLLASNRQTSAALNQIAICRQILNKEMGVEPSVEILALEQAILKREKLPKPRLFKQDESRSLDSFSSQSLLARERELNLLNNHFLSALSGHGKMIFISGVTGSGKTALVKAFASRAARMHPNLITLSSACAMHGEPSTPFYPFREIIIQLSHWPEQTEAVNGAEAIATRPVNQINQFVWKTLSEFAPDLVTLLKMGQRTVTVDPGQGQDGMVTLSLQRGSLYQQSAALLSRISEKFPLLITIEDMQWMDTDSLELLYYLGTLLKDWPILFIGTYRREDVAAGKNGLTHPLEGYLHEFTRVYGNISLDLDQSDGRSFVNKYLDALPNHFSANFHETLFRHTGGNALFTIDLVESLKSAGYLQLDEQNLWVDSPEIDWNQIPARIEAIIHQQIKRLPVFWQHALTVASVEGEYFTGEALAAVLKSQPASIIPGLSRVASRQHGLIKPEDVRMVNGKRLSIFSFRHPIYQRFLYQHLNGAERAILHEEVGNALESFYLNSNQLDQISYQLARHFEEAGQIQKAAGYYYRAGHTALQISAFLEAEKYLDHAYSLLQPEFSTEGNSRLAMDIQTDLSSVNLALHGWGSEERNRTLSAANLAAKHVGTATEQLVIDTKLVENLLGSGRWQEAVQKSQEILSQSEPAEKDVPYMQARMIQGVSDVFLGHLPRGLSLLEEVFAFIDARGKESFLGDTNSDEKIARVTFVIGLVFCGRTQQAQAVLDLALTEMRRESSSFVLGMGLTIGGISKSILLQDFPAAIRYSQELRETPDLREYRAYKPWIEFMDGWVEFTNGQKRSGLKKLMSWDAHWKNRHFLGYPFLLRTLADTLLSAGRIAEAEKIVRYGIQSIIEGAGSFVMRAEFYRLRGECQVVQGDADEAETSFREAMEIAQSQSAFLFLLEAANSLCRLKLAQGNAADDLQTLQQIYRNFTEGWNTAPLSTARELLRKGGLNE